MTIDVKDLYFTGAITYRNYKKIVIFVLKSNIFKLGWPQVLFSVFMILDLISFFVFDKFVKFNKLNPGRNY
ncbi:hypothetical protein DBR43_28985 [Pedobacter sp. KBW06]|nr:hypothetical protein DBR43_28985 [Pedobacter sp. KBW06]